MAGGPSTSTTSSPSSHKSYGPSGFISFCCYSFFHIFLTIFIANPLKQEFVVNCCHHYQVLARINKNSALSVSLSRPQWKYLKRSYPPLPYFKHLKISFAFNFFAWACRSGSERQCDSICSVCLDLGIFLNTRFALVWIYLWAIFQFWPESDALKCGHFHNIVPASSSSSSRFHTRDNLFSPFLLFL